MYTNYAKIDEKEDFKSFDSQKCKTLDSIFDLYADVGVGIR